MEKNGLFGEERLSNGLASLRVKITAEDLTETSADTDQTIALFTAAANSAVRFVKAVLVTPFKDASDAALNDTQLSIGDGSDADRLMPAVQVNENGTEVLKVFSSEEAITITTDLTGVDTGTDMTAAQAAQIEADLAAIAARINREGHYLYTAEDTVDLLVESMSAKSLSDIDTGEIHLFFEVV